MTDVEYVSVTEIFQVPMHDQQPKTPPSRAVQAARKHLTPMAQTPRFDPEVHTSHKKSMDNTKEEAEDSFVVTIGSRTPARITQMETTESGQKEDSASPAHREDEKDLSATEIVVRSPVKIVTRIEDSVEAIDDLEDAIEKMGEALPPIVDECEPVATLKMANHTSPNNTTKRPEPKKHQVTRKPSTGLAVKKTRAVQKATNPRPSTTKPVSHNAEVHSTTKTRPSLMAKSSPNMTKQATQPATSANPTPQAQAPPPKTAASTKRTLSSIHKPPFQPTKSTKQPTRPSFELPGEAISRKLKEQREERLKREDEENDKKREFKARPVRVSHAPVTIKATATSKARMSLVRGVSGTDTGTGTVVNDYAPRISSIRSNASRISSISSTTAVVGGGGGGTQNNNNNNNNKRLSSLPATHRRPSALLRKSSTAGTANTSAPRTRGPSASVSVKGKEVFGRDRLEKEGRERARREKEETARAARVQAAEKGRVKSREWAERKLKMEKMEKGEREKEGMGVENVVREEEKEEEKRKVEG